jgi:CRP/FNR family transcriptional regulator
MRFTMSLTHEELANMAGTSRETVTRIISRLKKEKLIDVKGSSFIILATEKLEHIS